MKPASPLAINTERFDNVVRMMLRVTKPEILKEEAKWRKAQTRKKLAKSKEN